MTNLRSLVAASLSAAVLAACGGDGAFTVQPTIVHPSTIQGPKVLARPYWTLTLVTTIPHPQGVAVGSDGSIYVSQPRSNRIERIRPDGTTTVVGSGFKHPEGIALYKGALFVADTRDAAVKRVAPNGKISSIAKGYWGAPNSVAVAPTGDVVVADPYNANTVSRVSPDGSVSPVLTQAQCLDPSGVAVDKNDVVYVACNSSSSVLEITPDGMISQLGPNISVPYAITVNASGVIYLTADRGQLWRITAAGHAVQVGTGLRFGHAPWGLAAHLHAIYISSHDRNAIYKITR